jgi:type IV pilus assembly protein PilA
MNNLEKKSNKRAFTLIELIVVIAILGVLAAILVPTMTNLITEARTQTAVANARTVYSIASAEAAFATASGSPITPGTYDSAEDGTFYTDVTTQAGEFDGTFTIVVGSDNTITSVTYDAGDEIEGVYPN